MAELRFLSKIEQVAAFLRAELAGGRWEGTMPGRMELAAELRLNERTAEEALRLLEWDGILVSGEKDQTQRSTLAEFVEGGTIGLA